MRNTKRITQVAVLILTLISSATSWAATEGKEGKSGKLERLGGKEDLTERPEVKNLKTTATTVAESQIVRILSVSRGDVKRVLREFKSQPEQYESLRKLLEKSLDSLSAEDTALVRAYMRLMSSSVGSFHLQPVELAKRASIWRPTSKAKLASVMERAQELAKSSKAGTREEAFRKALKEMGLEQKYDEKCKKLSAGLF